MDSGNLNDLRPLSNSNPALSGQTCPWPAGVPNSPSGGSRPHSYSETVPSLNAPVHTPNSPHTPSPTSQPPLPHARPPAITLDTRYTMSTDSTTSSNREDFVILAKDGKSLFQFIL